MQVLLSHLIVFFFLSPRYRPSLPVTFILSELAFDKLEDWSKFVQPFSLTYTDASHKLLDCKASMSALASF